jgi:hypothetical protein
MSNSLPPKLIKFPSNYELTSTQKNAIEAFHNMQKLANLKASCEK